MSYFSLLNLAVKPYLCRISIAVAVVFFLGACAPDTDTAATGTVEQAPVFTEESWKELISDQCSSYFDGCNNCVRQPGQDIAACTRKMCAEYAEPRCLDVEISATDEPEPQAKTVEYQCGDSARFIAAYGRYETEAKTIELAADEVLLRDSQTGEETVLTREQAASGEKYLNGDLMFWASGDDAMIKKGTEALYSDCRIYR